MLAGCGVLKDGLYPPDGTVSFKRVAQCLCIASGNLVAVGQVWMRLEWYLFESS